MGLYDVINFEMNCPDCGTLVDGFQSKDWECRMLTIDPEWVLNMYAICPKCQRWIELSRYGNNSQQEMDYRETPYTYEEVIELGFKLLEDKQ